MKALVTGGCGFIALNLIKELIKKGFRIRVVDIIDKKAMDFEAHSILLKNKSVEYYKIDLTVGDNLSEFSQDYEYIFHFAGVLGVETVTSNPSNTLFSNSIMAWNIAEFAKKQKDLKMLFYTSTSEVYSGTLETYGITFPTPESTALTFPDVKRPRNSYMISKIWGEAAFNYSLLPAVILRPHNIYGPRMGMRHVIPQLLSKSENLNNGDFLEVYSPQHTRSFCYIDDAINFILLIFEKIKIKSPITLNLGNSDEELSMKYLAEKIAKITKKELRIKELSTTAGSPERRHPDLRNIVNLTKYKPLVSLDEGIKKTYIWYKENVFSRK